MTGRRGAVSGVLAPVDTSTSSVAAAPVASGASHPAHVSTSRPLSSRRSVHGAADCLTCVRTASGQGAASHTPPSDDASRQASTSTAHTDTRLKIKRYSSSWENYLGAKGHHITCHVGSHPTSEQVQTYPKPKTLVL